MSKYDKTEPPPWGALPVEQYLLLNWNPASSEIDDQQRLRLVRDFVQVLTDIPEEWDRIRRNSDKPMVVEPSPLQIQTILEPWRPQHLRYSAAKIWHSDPQMMFVWVRTHYAQDEALRSAQDTQLQDWIRSVYEELEVSDNDFEDAWSWQVLRDPSFFNVGDDWKKVFDYMPELAGPFDNGYGRRDKLRNPNKSFQEDRERLRELIDHENYDEEERIAITEEDRWLPRWCIENVIQVVDQEAFETGKVKLVFSDPRGNVIRYSRCEFVGDWWTLGWELWGGPLESDPLWTGEAEGSGIGDKYRARGEIGRELYGVEDLLDAAPVLDSEALFRRSVRRLRDASARLRL